VKPRQEKDSWTHHKNFLKKILRHHEETGALLKIVGIVMDSLATFDPIFFDDMFLKIRYGNLKAYPTTTQKNYLPNSRPESLSGVVASLHQTDKATRIGHFDKIETNRYATLSLMVEWAGNVGRLIGRRLTNTLTTDINVTPTRCQATLDEEE
jgi:hypothetical protein